MKMLQTKQGVVVNVYVRPQSKEFQILVEEDGLVVDSCEPPVKGKVNQELVKKLSRLFGTNVQIISGQTSKQKRILIRGISAETVNYVLSRRIEKEKR